MMEEIQQFSSEKEQLRTKALLRMFQGEESQELLSEIEAWEELYGNLDMSPLDKNYCKLPYQDEIDEWMKQH